MKRKKAPIYVELEFEMRRDIDRHRYHLAEMRGEMPVSMKDVVVAALTQYLRTEQPTP